MNPEAIWTARAEADLLREFSRLEDFSEGSGTGLLNMVDAGVRLLRVMPELAPRYAGRHRRLVLKNPRFGLFYTIEDRGIIVQAVCDLRQSRETIMRHLGLNREG